MTMTSHTHIEKKGMMIALVEKFCHLCSIFFAKPKVSRSILKKLCSSTALDHSFLQIPSNLAFLVFEKCSYIILKHSRLFRILIWTLQGHHHGGLWTEQPFQSLWQTYLSLSGASATLMKFCSLLYWSGQLSLQIIQSVTCSYQDMMYSRQELWRTWAQLVAFPDNDPRNSRHQTAWIWHFPLNHQLGLSTLLENEVQEKFQAFHELGHHKDLFFVSQTMGLLKICEDNCFILLECYAVNAFWILIQWIEYIMATTIFQFIFKPLHIIIHWELIIVKNVFSLGTILFPNKHCYSFFNVIWVIENWTSWQLKLWFHSTLLTTVNTFDGNHSWCRMFIRVIDPLHIQWGWRASCHFTEILSRFVQRVPKQHRFLLSLRSTSTMIILLQVAPLFVTMTDVIHNHIHQERSNKKQGNATSTHALFQWSVLDVNTSFTCGTFAAFANTLYKNCVSSFLLSLDKNSIYSWIVKFINCKEVTCSSLAVRLMFAYCSHVVKFTINITRYCLLT